MQSPRAIAVLGVVLAAPAATSLWGCSGDSLPSIDQKAVIAKNTADTGRKARMTAKAKAADAEAQQKHPKLR